MSYRSRSQSHSPRQSPSRHSFQHSDQYLDDYPSARGYADYSLEYCYDDDKSKSDYYYQSNCDQGDSDMYRSSTGIYSLEFEPRGHSTYQYSDSLYPSGNVTVSDANHDVLGAHKGSPPKMSRSYQESRSRSRSRGRKFKRKKSRSRSRSHSRSPRGQHYSRERSKSQSRANPKRSYHHRKRHTSSESESRSSSRGRTIKRRPVLRHSRSKSSESRSSSRGRTTVRRKHLRHSRSQSISRSRRVRRHSGKTAHRQNRSQS